MSSWFLVLVFVVQILVLGALFLIGRRVFRSRMRLKPPGAVTVDGEGVATIPVLATFTGLRPLSPWIALAVNSLNPHLRIGPAGIDLRVLRRRLAPHEAVESVEVRTAPGTVNLCLTFRDSPFTFAANVGDEATAREALRRLPGFIPLGPKARALLDGAG